MSEIYEVWSVYEKEHEFCFKYLVVNMKTKKIQSSWTSLEFARKTCDDLNRADKAVLSQG